MKNEEIVKIELDQAVDEFERVDKGAEQFWKKVIVTILFAFAKVAFALFLIFGLEKLNVINIFGDIL